MATETKTHKYIGARLKRPNAVPRLTGFEKYTDDIQLPGMLHAAYVNSPYAHATLSGIDSAAAKALPGVIDVLTAADLPEHARNDAAMDRTFFFLASKRVTFVGQPVAVVVATDPAIAADAAQLVEVSYDPIPAVVHGPSAIQEDAPIVRPERSEQKPGQHPNLSAETVYQQGDIDQAFADAAATATFTMTTESVHQGYMEPRSATAAPDPTGGLTIWTATQGQFAVRTAVSQMLRIPETNVRVEPVTVGGGFGARFMLFEPLVGWLALRYMKPVKLTITRSEDFAGTTPAPEKVIMVELAADSSGNLIGVRGDLTFNTGYFSKSPFEPAALMLGSGYRIANYHITTREVFSNRSGTGAYRAPGLPQVAFALESAIDDLAHQLELSPLEIRKRNAASGGDYMFDGAEWQPFDPQPLFDEVERSPVWSEPIGPNEGVGIALGLRRGFTDSASANVRLNADGTVQVVVGSMDLTGTTTGLTQIAAEVFGIPPEQVQVTTANTETAPHAGRTGGSKILYTVGNAVIEAAGHARSQVMAIAASELEVGPDDLELLDDRVVVRGADDHFMTLAQIYQRSTEPGTPYPPVFGHGNQANEIKAAAVSACVARVRVDPDSGNVELIGVMTAQDAGRAINPSEVEGQIRGGVLQGIGIGLYEGLVYDDGGQLLTGTMMDYALPKATQAPSIDVVLIEDPSPHGPFGARGVAESPIIAPAAAIGNAIFNATGVRMTELPMTPEKIWQAIQAR
jgi:CO/xanthine dehydrogenase Mo-binding subunit